jgi:soluble lytic murein transglycosylase-like protein
LRALGRRPYAAAELQALLVRKGNPGAEVAAALDRLTQGGYLDDRAFAEQFARSRAQHRRWGPRRIASDLRARGVAEPTIAAALGRSCEQLEPGRLLRELIAARGGIPADPRGYARLWRLALRRGFDSEQVRQALGAPPAPRRGLALLAALVASLAAAPASADIYQAGGAAHSFTNIPRRDAVTVIRTPAAPRPGRRGPNELLSELIGATAAKTGLNPALLTAVIEAESAFNPDAVSPKGARGLMQLMPATAERMGVERIHDPEQNLAGGARYLKYLIDMFGGDLRLALAAYNAGENLVKRLGRIPRIAETQAYVARIVDRFGVADHPFSTRAANAPPVLRTRIFASRDARGVLSFSSAPLPSSDFNP